MGKQGKQFKWIPANLLLNKIRHSKEGSGNYSIVVLSNNNNVLIDRKNLIALVIDRSYRIDNNFKRWLKRGFIVVQHKKERNDYILDAKDGSLVCICNIFEPYAFLAGKSDYFMIFNAQGKLAILNKDGRQVTDWYESITSFGLALGQSDYYIVYKEEINKSAIFDKDGRQISNWYDGGIRLEGLALGQSNYYIARTKDKYAIFHKNGQQVTDWFDYIYPEGLVEGKSDYYVAEKDGKAAIFHKDGYQVTDWFDKIYPVGLVEGKTDYYAVLNNEIMYIGKLGSSKLLGPYKKVEFFDYLGFLFLPSATSITVCTLDDKKIKMSKQEVDNFFDEKEVEDEQAR
ncbi:MAG: hypothetical protein ACPLXO_04525 [Desulfurella sp.]